METQPLAIISGGNGYLGSVIADTIAGAGWRVVILARTLSKEASTESYECDITDPDSVARVIKTITDTYGVIQACIHTASPRLARTRILDTDLESFDSHIATAIRGAYLLARATVPHMSIGAAFIGITTTAIESGKSPSPLGSYIPAKYALRGFLRVLSSEVQSAGIRVYAVAPGFLPGGLNRDIPQKVVDFLTSKSDAGVASPDDIAEIIKEICINPEAIPSGSSISFPPRLISPL